MSCCNARAFSACQYDMVGPEGIVESHQITRDGKAGATEAVDCKWYIRAPPRSKVSHTNRHTGVKLHIFSDISKKKKKRKLGLTRTAPVRRQTGEQKEILNFSGFKLDCVAFSC